MKIKLSSVTFALLLVLSVTVTTFLSDSGNANICSVISLSPDEQQPPWFYEVRGGVNSISISSDGNYTAAGGEDNRVYLFSRTRSTPLWSYQTEGAVDSVSISSNGSYVVAGSKDGKVYFFSRENNLLWSYQAGPPTYFSPKVSISSDGSYVAVMGTDNLLYLFSHSSNTPLWSHDLKHGRYRLPVAISSDGHYIVVHEGWEGLYLFSRESSTPLWKNSSFFGIPSISVSIDGSYIATCNGWERTILFSRQSNEPLWSYKDRSPVGIAGIAACGPQPYHDCKQVSISSNGDYIVSCVNYATFTKDGCIENQIGRVHLFSRSSSTPLWTYEENEWIYLVSISSNGDYIAAANDEGKVYLFSREGNMPLRSWVIGSRFHYGSLINSISISSDGSYIAVGNSHGVNLLSKDVVNSLPTLTAEDVFPESGEVGVTTFTFEVTYTDPDGDPPEYIKGYISTYDPSYTRIGLTEQDMVKASGDYSTGAVYRCTWVPRFAGGIIYGFAATDGKMGLAFISGRKSPYVVRAVTALTILPQEFVLGFNRQTTLTATLESYGTPVPGKIINWSATGGSFSSLSSTTDSSGRASVIYHAPENATNATITASFNEDNSYRASNGDASCTVFKATFTFRRPDGTPLANTEVYYGLSSDNVTEHLGTTDNEGKITSAHHEVANQTIFFKTSDGKYVGSTSISSMGGDVTVEFTEVSEFPTLWVVVAVVIVAAAIGALVLVKKRK